MYRSFQPIHCLFDFAAQEVVDGERATVLATVAFSEIFKHLPRACFVSGSHEEPGQQAGGWSRPWNECISLLGECQGFLKRLPDKVESLERKSREEVRIELKDLPCLGRRFPIPAGLPERSREADAHNEIQRIFFERPSMLFDGFERSVAEDPEYAPAHAGLADGYIILAVYSLLPPEVAVVKARAAAEEALRLDPNLSEAHHSMGFVHFFTWRWGDAEREYRRAIELSPNLALTHGQLGIMLSEQHRFEEGLSEIECAKQIDPVSPMPGFYAAGHHTVQRQYDRALEECQRALEIESNFMPLFWTQSVILSLSGRHEEALACAEQVVTLSQRQVFYTALLGMVYARAGRRTEAEETLAELEKRSASEYVDPLLYTHVYTALGDTEHALDFLERAAEKQSAVILFTLFMPACLDPLRPEPRFQQVIRRIGLPM